mmetsp:Transcript_28374/g.39473  ORF Transcript_28374/g.39473 Transcript_28374/m.39473 type:complete len:84 (+) Transcript_28374:207-458(+)
MNVRFFEHFVRYRPEIISPKKRIENAFRMNAISFKVLRLQQHIRTTSCRVSGAGFGCKFLSSEDRYCERDNKYNYGRREADTF